MSMTIVEFAKRLEEALLVCAVPSDLANEAAFEHEVVLSTIKPLAKNSPGVLICTHRFDESSVCKPNCESAGRGVRDRVIGCHRCWTSSKAWGTVSAFGMRHTFDMVARDEAGKTLAVEVKWIGLKGGRAPNSEFQRFLGQCALAAARHNIVLGVCGLRGKLKSHYDEHRNELLKNLESVGVRVVVLQADEDLNALEETASD
jgi:hypothetical protein